MADIVFNIAKEDWAESTLDWLNDDIQVLLVGAAYAEDPDHEFVADVLAAAAEVTGGTGYARKVLGTKTVFRDDATNKVFLRADPVVWDDADFGDAEGILVFSNEGGSDATNHVISFHETGYPVTTVGTDFTHNWHADGIVQIA